MGFSQASRRHLELNSTKLEHVLCSFHPPPPLPPNSPSLRWTLFHFMSSLSELAALSKVHGSIGRLLGKLPRSDPAGQGVSLLQRKPDDLMVQISNINPFLLPERAVVPRSAVVFKHPQCFSVEPITTN